MKEEDQATARDLNKMDRRNMPDRKFKITIIKILTGEMKRGRTSEGGTSLRLLTKRY